MENKHSNRGRSTTYRQGECAHKRVEEGSFNVGRVLVLNNPPATPLMPLDAHMLLPPTNPSFSINTTRQGLALVHVSARPKPLLYLTDRRHSAHPTKSVQR